MKNVSGSTASEAKMIRAIQAAVGAVQDGSIGAQTMSDIAARLGADCFPLALTIYGQPVIIARDALPAAVSGPLAGYANAISGTFSYANRPCSILVTHGETVCGYACHAHLGKPESVLYRTQDGRFGFKRCLYAAELPSATAWAVGGVGLLESWDPEAEGFAGAYADVLRRTAHTFLGVKQNYTYLGYCSNMTGAEVNAHVRRLGLELAIMLDGGHVAAIHSAETRINTGTRQYAIVQGI